MSKIDIQVLGTKPPKRPEGPIKRLCRKLSGGLKATLLRPRMILVSAIAGFVIFVGTPHAGWDYQCRHAMRGIGSCTSVSWCAYYGIHGRRIERPEYGERCKLVTFLPVDWDKLMKGIL